MVALLTKERISILGKYPYKLYSLHCPLTSAQGEKLKLWDNVLFLCSRLQVV